ncbi:MAG: hypothetical protein V1843_01320 [bacterium]
MGADGDGLENVFTIGANWPLLYVNISTIFLAVGRVLISLFTYCIRKIKAYRRCVVRMVGVW